MSTMSYFNEEQQGEMRYLASLKPEEKCWCGWCRAGHCDTPSCCAPEHTMADRMKVTCECGSYPSKPGGQMIHRRNCASASQPPGAATPKGGE